jgi:hypothetical protein
LRRMSVPDGAVLPADIDVIGAPWGDGPRGGTVDGRTPAPDASW